MCRDSKSSHVIENFCPDCNRTIERKSGTRKDLIRARNCRHFSWIKNSEKSLSGNRFRVFNALAFSRVLAWNKLNAFENLPKLAVSLSWNAFLFTSGRTRSIISIQISIKTSSDVYEHFHHLLWGVGKLCMLFLFLVLFSSSTSL